MNAGLITLSENLTIVGYAEQYTANQIFNNTAFPSNDAMMNSFIIQFADLLSKNDLVDEWQSILRNIEFCMMYPYNNLEPSKSEYNQYFSRLYTDKYEVMIVFTFRSSETQPYLELNVVKANFEDERENFS